MKIKIPILLVLVVVLSSCRKEYVSLNHSLSPREEIAGNQKENSEDLGETTIGEAKGAAGITSKRNKDNFNTKEEITSKKESEIENQKATTIPFSALRKDIQRIKKIKREKKEMNPTLSRALWMTIPGGLAVILGIALYSVAPTGLLIFAFSLVFLVGLVSLILYWANPKPKM